MNRQSAHGESWIPSVYLETNANFQIKHFTVKATAWKFPKFHKVPHIVDDIERFGAPMNYCAQRPESLLIPVAKKPGHCTQKRQRGVANKQQVAQRLSYSIIIDTMYSRLWENSKIGSNACGKDPVNTQTPNTGRTMFATLACFAIPKFHKARTLPSREKWKRTLRAWIPRLRYLNSCCNNLTIQYVFVLHSGFAKISSDAILAFSPIVQCTIG